MGLYHDVIAAAALKTNALAGAQAAGLAASYLTRPLVQGTFKSAVFPFAAYVDALVRAEGMVAAAAAKNRRSSLRPYMIGVTGNLADGADIPRLTAGGKEIIGAWGAVRDAADGASLDEGDPGEIALLRDNANSWRVSEAYLYAFDGDVIRHTRTNVYGRVCFYDRAAQKTAVTNDGTVLFPGVTDVALLAGLLSEMTRDSQFAAQAAGFASYFAVVLAAFTGGDDAPPPPPPEVAQAMVAVGGAE